MIVKFGRGKLAIALIAVAGTAAIAADTPKPQDKGEWVAPQKADSLINIFADDEKAAGEGKKLFKSMCEVCHGAKGKGDGIAGAALKPRPSNFTAKKFQDQSDGAIFWKMTEGRSPMASYKKILTPEQRWQLVKYLRELKKK